MKRKSVGRGADTGRAKDSRIDVVQLSLLKQAKDLLESLVREGVLEKVGDGYVPTKTRGRRKKPAKRIKRDSSRTERRRRRKKT